MAELNNNDEGVVLTPVEQAAIVLLSIGEEPAAAVLRCLERDELIELTQVMSRMSGIKVDSVKYAIQKFFDDYREQSGLHGASRTYLKRSLDLALGSDIANSVLNTIYGDAIRPMMARLQYASPKWLAEFISHEHVQMQAVFLAFLPPALAGQIIEALPEARPRPGAAEPGAPGRDRPRPAGRTGRAGARAACPRSTRRAPASKACARWPRS
jgi:flagellar motor switch protein FliG